MLLSGRNEVEAERAEDVVKESGLQWTIVRCAFFAQNFNEGAWLDEVLAGTVALPVDHVQEPFVDVDDIADVVVAALTDDRHVGQLYELTGPRLLSFRDAVAEIGKAAGRDISFVSVPIDDYTAMLTEHGLPQDFIWLLNHLFTEVLGSKAQLADGVRRALGREPKDFADYRPRDRCDRRVDATTRVRPWLAAVSISVVACASVPAQPRSESHAHRGLMTGQRTTPLGAAHGYRPLRVHAGSLPALVTARAAATAAQVAAQLVPRTMGGTSPAHWQVPPRQPAGAAPRPPA